MVQDGCGGGTKRLERPTTTLFIGVSELKNCRDINSRLTLLNMSADHRNSQLVTAGALGSGEEKAFGEEGSGVRGRGASQLGLAEDLFLAPPFIRRKICASTMLCSEAQDVPISCPRFNPWGFSSAPQLPSAPSSAL